MSRILVMLLLGAATASAWAGARSGAGQLTCNEDGSQAELNACAADEWAAADADLNAAWRQVLARHKDNRLAIEKLRAAQRQWIRLRDADLEALFPLAEGQQAYVEYGSMYPLLFHSAKARATRERTRYLRDAFLQSDTDGQ